MKLPEIINNIPELVKIAGDLNREISSMTHDSRRVGPDCLFIAVRGLITDGHNFIDLAIKTGALAIVYDRPEITIPEHLTAILVQDSRQALPLLAGNFYQHPERSLTLIGITGTNGKTTSNYFLQHLLMAGGTKTGRVGTTGAALEALEIDLIHTTPEASDLYKLLSTFVEHGAAAATLEVSSHALSQGRVDGLTFQAAIFSNLTQDHLDYHQSFDEYLKAKQLLFKGLSHEAVALVNIDDPSSEDMIAGCRARIIRYGFHSAADYRIDKHSANENGIELQVKTPRESVTVQVNTVGTFNIYNFLSAFATALELGCQLDPIVKAAQTLPCVPGRLEKMNNKAPFKVFVDYAHTPDAMKTVLQTLAEAYPDNRLITVFGCGGDRDQGKRAIMGDIATQLSTQSIITDDNPRTEASMAIIDAIVVGCKDRNNYKIIQDRSTAVKTALIEAEQGDIVAILGKGHEPYQEIMGERKPYSDMDIVKQFMEQHGYSA